MPVSHNGIALPWSGRPFEASLFDSGCRRFIILKMISKNKIITQMNKQGYRFIGPQGAVKICRWTKKSLNGEGCCYKEKFYGIKSHKCCQVTPWLGCDNKCLHCWRAIEFDFNNFNKNKITKPQEFIQESIQFQRKLLQGFKKDPKSKKKQLSKADQFLWKEAQEPDQFAISLSGEPTIYPYIGEFIQELRKQDKTSFLVTNGLHPLILKELYKKNQLPTQLYVSVNSSNKKDYLPFHRSQIKQPWKKLNSSLELLPKLNKKTRTVFRINLIKDLNMSDKNINEFAELIKKSQARFIELKGFMSVGFARKRLGYNRMPYHEDIKEFAKKLEKQLNKIDVKYKILDEHYFSRAIVLGNSKTGKKDLKIKKKEV
ncbi:MAG: 4-demethylwyosine synthase TYW1 [Nanoarchaeota archaeon]